MRVLRSSSSTWPFVVVRMSTLVLLLLQLVVVVVVVATTIGTNAEAETTTTTTSSSAAVAARMRRLRLVPVETTTTATQQQDSATAASWPFLEEDGSNMFMNGFRFMQELSMATTPPLTTAPSPSPAPVAGATPTPTFTSTTNSPTAIASNFSFTNTSDTLAPSASPTTIIVNRTEVIAMKCNMTEEERSLEISNVLVTISDIASLTYVDGPRYPARIWLDEQDGAILCPNINDTERLLQRYRLAVLYFSWNGPQWTTCNANQNTSCLIDLVSNGTMSTDNSTNGTTIPSSNRPWLSAVHECYWFGLSCFMDPDDIFTVDDFFPLAELNLQQNNVVGNFANYPELFGFEYLTDLTLNGNALDGSIPSLLGQMNALQYLDLQGNRLQGTLPVELYTNNTNLLALGLGYNQFNGTISNEIGQLSKLTILFLEANAFSGPVPVDGLYQLYNLVALTLEYNQFSGSVEPLCEVEDERRINTTEYLRFFYADCQGDPPKVNCSCCSCY